MARLTVTRARMLAVAGLTVVAGCSPSGQGVQPIGAAHQTSTTASPPTSSTSAPGPATTSVESTKAAILAAYRAAWIDIDAVDRHYPVDFFDPRLANHMAGDQLKRSQEFANVLKIQGQFVAGPRTDTSAAILKQLVGTVAVVSDCDVDDSILMDGRTNQVVKPGSTARMLRNAEMELIAGTWKMTDFTNVGVTCTDAS